MAKRKCGICRQEGHNRRTCPQKDNPEVVAKAEAKAKPKRGATKKLTEAAGKVRKSKVMIKDVEDQADRILRVLKPGECVYLIAWAQAVKDYKRNNDNASVYRENAVALQGYLKGWESAKLHKVKQSGN